MDEERLIVEVENYKISYESSHPYYKDTQRKDKAWAEIARVLGLDDCKYVYVLSREKRPSSAALHLTSCSTYWLTTKKFLQARYKVMMH